MVIARLFEHNMNVKCGRDINNLVCEQFVFDVITTADAKPAYILRYIKVAFTSLHGYGGLVRNFSLVLTDSAYFEIVGHRQVRVSY